MANNEAHNKLVRLTLEQLAINGYSAYKNETGVWKDTAGRPHPYGKVGSGDIIIILPPYGKHVEAEAKTGTGRQNKNQKLHQKYVVERNGGSYILFREIPFLLKRLEEIYFSQNLERCELL